MPLCHANRIIGQGGGISNSAVVGCYEEQAQRRGDRSQSFEKEERGPYQVRQSKLLKYATNLYYPDVSEACIVVHPVPAIALSTYRDNKKD